MDLPDSPTPPPSTTPKTGVPRRDFLRGLGAVSTGAALAGGRLFAQEALSPEALYARYVPADKGLAPDWLKSLTTRGHALDAGITASRQDGNLDVIGMTAGGIACGTVYLSGDGRLWVWDIFNQHHEGVVPNRDTGIPEGLAPISKRLTIVRERDGANFLVPPSADTHTNGVEQDFRLEIEGAEARTMDAKGWAKVDFEGRWPVGTVRFSDPASPVSAQLEAFSPFIPLNLADSSLPLTVLDYTLENTSDREVRLRFTGSLNNPLGQYSHHQRFRATRLVKGAGWEGFTHELREDAPGTAIPPREDRILFDFEGGYDGWEVSGEAFGKQPVRVDEVPDYQGDLGAKGKGLVNSHASAPGDSTEEKDAATGRLLSPEFTIDRNFLSYLIGGGKNRQAVAVRLLIDGNEPIIRTGQNKNAMTPMVIDVVRHQGKKARIEILDKATGGWGHIGADQFVLTDRRPEAGPMESQLDYGSMSLAALGDDVTSDASGEVKAALTLAPGEKRTLRFAVAWHLPNLNPRHGCGERRRHYATRFPDATAVVGYFAKNQERLCQDTRDWVATWNDSTLPQWLLDRSILTANTLQTQNSLIFEDGRFWAWEGIGCCPGTCGHVWQYAQGHARLFPEIERNLREVTDFKLAQQPNGEVFFRGTNNRMSAIDAQCSYVLRVLRDHQLSDDPGYLERVWPATRKAIDYLIDFDGADSRGGLDGLLDGRQHNTLDAEWYGKVHVLCSMYLAALSAGRELAERREDGGYAERCAKVLAMGRKKIATLFNGEFYEQDEDPEHLGAIGVGKGCYIDQVMGQFWANQTGLGRIYDAGHQKKALRSLWRYNFVPEYGDFRQAFKQGRFYASSGDAGLLMCTWPKGGLRDDFKKHWQYMYFNEFMTGFEYQAAAHMVAERDPDLVEKGLAITRSIHDRYSHRRGRNPYNEIECSDHYARAGSSFGVFLAMCGFHFDQDLGLLRFDPVVEADRFKAPFLASEGWGTFERDGDTVRLSVKHGTLRLDRLEFGARTPGSVTVNGKPAKLPGLRLAAGDSLEGRMTG